MKSFHLLPEKQPASQPASQPATPSIRSVRQAPRLPDNARGGGIMRFRRPESIAPQDAYRFMNERWYS